ncbi:MAG: 30S ribosomal protein S17 [Treponema sp.]|nr:MAG: 30S ribosomal protein S17 [Spirochaetes bacterium ADurb.Bin269]TAH55920.1 MAG: 30S ribosomal protein S17 [Treponema sp.]HPX48580.1 30S ribosomal protein S17 [Treponemataceae bacterium]HQL32572.1 30S ribosomal protein S17 [Treponemataceae bacterium]
MEEKAEKTTGNREFVGLVTSDKMNKTITVQVSTKKLHRLYKKYVSRSKKYKAHDENNDAHIGDTVRIVESRPISKDKCWRLVEILDRAK